MGRRSIQHGGAVFPLRAGRVPPHASGAGQSLRVHARGIIRKGAGDQPADLQPDSWGSDSGAGWRR